MESSSKGIYILTIPKIIQGNIIIQENVTLTVQKNPVDQTLYFIKNYLFKLNCNEISNSINICIENFSDILLNTISYIQTLLTYSNVNDYSYKAQLLKFKEIINYIMILISNINITVDCDNNYIVQVFKWLYDNTLTIEKILEVVNGLTYFNEQCICNNRGFEALMIKFINSNTQLESNIPSLKQLLSWIINSMNYNKSYNPIFGCEYNGRSN